MTPRTKLIAGLAGAAAIVTPFALTSGGGSVDVFVGSTPTPVVPFPDESNTGVPSGTSLTAYSGPNPVTADDTVIDSKTITGCLVVAATNVTITKSVVNCSSNVGIQLADGPETGLLIEDSEIECTSSSGGTGIEEGNFTVRRTEVRSCENGMSLNQNVLAEDNLFWKLENGGGDPHEDGVQFSCGHYTGNGGDTAYCGGENYVGYEEGALNITLSHNTISGVNKDDSLGTSAIISNPTTDGFTFDTDILIDGNLIVGGGTTIYCPRPGQGVNYDVTNNTFDVNLAGEDDCADEDDVSGNVNLNGDPYTLD